MNHLRLPDVWLDSVNESRHLPPSSALSLVVNLDLNLVGVRWQLTPQPCHTHSAESLQNVTPPLQGVAALPANVAGMHDCCLVGPFFLQVPFLDAAQATVACR